MHLSWDPYRNRRRSRSLHFDISSCERITAVAVPELVEDRSSGEAPLDRVDPTFVLADFEDLGQRERGSAPRQLVDQGLAVPDGLRAPRLMEHPQDARVVERVDPRFAAVAEAPARSDVEVTQDGDEAVIRGEVHESSLNEARETAAPWLNTPVARPACARSGATAGR